MLSKKSLYIKKNVFVNKTSLIILKYNNLINLKKIDLYVTKPLIIFFNKSKFKDIITLFGIKMNKIYLVSIKKKFTCLKCILLSNLNENQDLNLKDSTT